MWSRYFEPNLSLIIKCFILIYSKICVYILTYSHSKNLLLECINMPLMKMRFILNLWTQKHESIYWFYLNAVIV